MSAAEWVGPSDCKNDRLDIDEIAAHLPTEAAALKAILVNTTVAGVDRMRKAASADAQSAKTIERRLAVAIVAGSALAALASGLLLYGQGGADAPTSSSFVDLAKKYSIAISVVQIVALFVATTASGFLAGKNFGKLWTDNRRDAETSRIKIFNDTVALAAVVPGTGPESALRQVLEFFRRYQLDLQICYYEKASKRETGSATMAVLVTSLLGGVTVVLGLVGGISSSLLFLAAFLGIAVPILLSAAQSWMTTTAAAAKAASYKSAWKALENLKLDLTRVQTAADAGDVDEVKKFMDGVHGVMSVENGAFVGAGPLPAPPTPGTNPTAAPVAQPDQ